MFNLGEFFNMKKTLIALAALAATGAFAQSTVTLYGTVDAALARYSSEGVSKTGIYNSQLGSSLLGFMGTEDLGGGMKANFKLEGGLANDFGGGKGSNSNNQLSGAAPAAAGGQGLVFQRYSYVGLSGGFGEVRLGRDYTSTFQQVVAAVDPFGTNGPADSSVMTLFLGAVGKQATTAGASNMIGYITPAMGGFGAKAQIFFGENASNLPAGSDDGNGYSLVLNYANGPIYVALGQQVTKGTVTAGTFGDYTQKGLSASYNFGMAKAVYTYAAEDLITSATTTATNKSNLLGVIVPMGAANLKASYVRSVTNVGAGVAENVGTLFGIGADYALSKRTTLFGTWSRVTNDNSAATGFAYSAGNSALAAASTNPSSQGLAIGVKHSF